MVVTSGGHRAAGRVFAVAVAAAVVLAAVSYRAPASATASGANVRVVNLARVRSKPSSIKVFDTSLAQKGEKPLATLAYGRASKYFQPRVDPSNPGSTTLSFYRPGTPTNSTLLGQWNESLAASDRVTVLVEPNDTDPKHVPVYTVPEWEAGGTTPLPDAPAGKALVLGQGFGLPKSNATTFGVQYGILGHGCISPAPDNLGNISYIGATTTVAIPIDPGRHRIAAYNTADTSCTKKPLAAPVAINARAGDRIFVLTFGSPRHPLELLALPIRRPN